MALDSGAATWLTHREAADLLGVGASTVVRMPNVGQLHPRLNRAGNAYKRSLSRREVAAAVARRAYEAGERARRRVRQPISPPDIDHVWLAVKAAAGLLGMSPMGGEEGR